MVFEKTDGRAEAAWNRQHVTKWDGSVAGVPPGYRIVAVDTASGAKLRDIVSFRRDLELAVVYADAFAAHVADGKLQNSRDPIIGLWNAAVVSYGRAFNGGVRHGAKVSTEQFDESEIEAHDYFLNLRNKHIAHAVNGYEDTTIIAYLTNSSFMPRAVTRTGRVHHDMIEDPVNLPLKLRALCVKLVEELNLQIRTIHFTVARELSELGLNEVYAFPDIELAKEIDLTRSRRRK